MSPSKLVSILLGYAGAALFSASGVCLLALAGPPSPILLGLSVGWGGVCGSLLVPAIQGRPLNWTRPGLDPLISAIEWTIAGVVCFALLYVCDLIGFDGKIVPPYVLSVVFGSVAYLENLRVPAPSGAHQMSES